MIDLRVKLNLNQIEFALVFGNFVRGKAFRNEYISMIERGEKPCPLKFEKWLNDFELKVLKPDTVMVLAETETPYKVRTVQSAEDGARKYLDVFLETCKHDPDRLGWTLVELQAHFPLDKWDKKTE